MLCSVLRAASSSWSGGGCWSRGRRARLPPTSAYAKSIWARPWKRYAMAETLLALRDIRAGYGDAVVLDGISFDISDHGSLAVLGRNGVGKSTLLLTIMGYTNVTRGTITWRGVDITYLPPHRRALDGIGWVAQEREIFPSLSVE